MAKITKYNSDVILESKKVASQIALLKEMIDNKQFVLNNTDGYLTIDNNLSQINISSNLMTIIDDQSQLIGTLNTKIQTLETQLATLTNSVNLLQSQLQPPAKDYILMSIELDNGDGTTSIQPQWQLIDSGDMIPISRNYFNENAFKVNFLGVMEYGGVLSGANTDPANDVNAYCTATGITLNTGDHFIQFFLDSNTTDVPQVWEYDGTTWISSGDFNLPANFGTVTNGDVIKVLNFVTNWDASANDILTSGTLTWTYSIDYQDHFLYQQSNTQGGGGSVIDVDGNSITFDFANRLSINPNWLEDLLLSKQFVSNTNNLLLYGSQNGLLRKFNVSNNAITTTPGIANIPTTVSLSNTIAVKIPYNNTTQGILKQPTGIYSGCTIIPIDTTLGTGTNIPTSAAVQDAIANKVEILDDQNNNITNLTATYDI